MKKLLFALSAMALLGLATACVDPVEQNPNYDPITNSVTTQFVLNISAAENPETKQMASTPQIGGSFRGIENATLFAFSQTNDGRKLLSPTTATTTFDLSAALSAGSITDDSSRRIIDLSLPVGTNTLVFYGMASKNGKNSDEVGKLEYIYPDKNLAHIGSFAVPRLDPRTLESDYFDDIEDIILKTWNYFLKVGINGNYGWDNTAVTSVSAPNLTGSLSLTGKAIHWVDYTKAINDDGTAAIRPFVLI